MKLLEDDVATAAATEAHAVPFGPKLPDGVPEANWAQTVPGKGWNMLFGLYGPLDPWFDKTWCVGEVELVK